MTLAAWLILKREENRRLFVPEYRAWLAAGASPLPVEWKPHG